MSGDHCDHDDDGGAGDCGDGDKNDGCVPDGHCNNRVLVTIRDFLNGHV